MAFTTAKLLTDGNGNPIPQVYDPSTDSFEAWTGEIVGSSVEEQRTEVDEAAGVISFDKPVQIIEIYNRDTNSGVFTVNNIELTIPAGQVFAAAMGGIPDTNVLVSGSQTYIITRYS